MANISLTLRRPKGVHLTIDEVDANFLNLKNGIIAEEQARIDAINALLGAFDDDLSAERDARISQDNYLLSLIQSEMAIREAQDRALDAKIDASVDRFKVFPVGQPSPTPNEFKPRTISGFEAYDSTDFPHIGTDFERNRFYSGITVSGLASVFSAQLAFHWNSEENPPRGLFFRTNDDTSDRLAWSSWTKIWHEQNDGSGSGLDADSVDGIHARTFSRINLASSANWTHITENMPVNYNVSSTQPDLPFRSIGEVGNIHPSNSPFGRPALVWLTRNNDPSPDADGGWVKNIKDIDTKRDYMSVVYIKRTNNFETGIPSVSGNIYHGCGDTLEHPDAFGSSNVVDLATGVVDINPYWLNSPVETLPLNVWCVSIGYILHDLKVLGTVDWGAGLYRLDTGQRIVTYKNFKHVAGKTTQVHRTFAYYSTDRNLEIHWWNPGFYEMNGSEPSFLELTGGKGLSGSSDGVDSFKVFARDVVSPDPSQFKPKTISGFEAYSSRDFPSSPEAGPTNGFYSGITIAGSETSGVASRAVQLAFNWNSESGGVGEDPPRGLFFRVNDDTGNLNAWSPWTKIWNSRNDDDLVFKVLNGVYTSTNKTFLNYKEKVGYIETSNGSTVTITNEMGPIHNIWVSGFSAGNITISMNSLTFPAGSSVVLYIAGNVSVNWNLSFAAVHWLGTSSPSVPPALSTTQPNCIVFLSFANTSTTGNLIGVKVGGK